MDEAIEAFAALQRSFVLLRMRQLQHTNELMVMYNMSVHACAADPVGIHYALRVTSGPNPEMRVRLDVLGTLMQECAASCALLNLNTNQ